MLFYPVYPCPELFLCRGKFPNARTKGPSKRISPAPTRAPTDGELDERTSSMPRKIVTTANELPGFTSPTFGPSNPSKRSYTEPVLHPPFLHCATRSEHNLTIRSYQSMSFWLATSAAFSIFPPPSTLFCYAPSQKYRSLSEI